MWAADSFLLGLASGVAVLTITAYRHVSPAWLKALLIASGILVAHRYALITQWPGPGAAPHTLLSSWWAIRAVGFTLPAVFAVDQLIRHPAMTPRKLLRWYGIVAAAAAVILAATHALGGFMAGHLIVLAGFSVGFVGLCAMFWQKIPISPVRSALALLMLGYGSLGASMLIVASGAWPDSALFFPEMGTLIALWQAYETGARLQTSGS